MKEINILLSIALALISFVGISQNQLKRYEVKSGMVEYITTTSGKVMGSTVEGTGIENLYFKDWGAVEVKVEKSSKTTTTNMLGKSKTETSDVHTMNKLDNGETYFVDFDKRQITAGRDMAMDMITAFQPNADAGATGKSMLESMGGKKTGTENFLGYSCEIWELAGGKQWIYKGVMLKLDMTVMGIKTTTVAKSAKFDVTVPDSRFKLPDFPIQKQESFMDNENYDQDSGPTNEDMDKLSKMSFEEWKKLVLAEEENTEMKTMSDAELRQSFDMMQKMIKAQRGN
ncbi:MAG: hypothetical protein K9H64_19770 [Bacteroidales bacterium]|nr:hypothetical protein [Bacteroidales bacterium]MCF8458299.1 hypothetical protein [Bacteroidales bacterium]